MFAPGQRREESVRKKQNKGQSARCRKRTRVTFAFLSRLSLGDIVKGDAHAEVGHKGSLARGGQQVINEQTISEDKPESNLAETERDIAPIMLEMDCDTCRHNRLHLP